MKKVSQLMVPRSVQSKKKDVKIKTRQADGNRQHVNEQNRQQGNDPVRQQGCEQNRQQGNDPIRQQGNEQNRQQGNVQNRQQSNNQNMQQGYEQNRQQGNDQNMWQGCEQNRQHSNDQNRQQGNDQNRQQGNVQNRQQGNDQNMQQGYEQNRKEISEQNMKQGIEQNRQQGNEQNRQQGNDQNMQQGNEQNKQNGNEIKEYNTACSSATYVTVREILTDLVNQSCLHAEIIGKSDGMNGVPISVADAIKLQSDAPYVDVGPLSYSKKVPVYHRSSKPARHYFDKGTKVLTGLTWEPGQSSRRPKNRKDGKRGYYPRQWEYTEAGKQYLHRPASHRGFEFTVMSYNVLAQNLLEDNYWLYTNSPSYVLEWKFRRKQLMKELKYHCPDVICLQEVNSVHYEEFFLPELKNHGYDGVYMKRTGNKMDGCATFYKEKKFGCVEVVKVPYCHNHGGIVLDRDNVGVIVMLKPHTNSVDPHKTLVVANTHLLFNPKRGDVKLAQLMMLLAELDRCAYTGAHPDIYQALIVCGDFNSQPQSDLYKLVVMGFLEYEGLLIREISGQDEGQYGHGNATLRKNFFPNKVGISDYCKYCDVSSNRWQPDQDDDVQVLDPQGSGVLQHELRLVSVYEHWLSRLRYRHREITTHHGKAACTVDYLFYGVRKGQVRFHQGEVQTKNIQEGHLCLLARYGLLSDRELRDFGSLPNDQYSSDHISLIARFLMT